MKSDILCYLNKSKTKKCPYVRCVAGACFSCFFHPRPRGSIQLLMLSFDSFFLPAYFSHTLHKFFSRSLSPCYDSLIFPSVPIPVKPSPASNGFPVLLFFSSFLELRRHLFHFPFFFFPHSFCPHLFLNDDPNSTSSLHPLPTPADTTAILSPLCPLPPPFALSSANHHLRPHLSTFPNTLPPPPLILSSLRSCSLFDLLSDSAQIPGEFHGRRARRRHAWLPSFRRQTHHSPAKGTNAHASHVQVSNRITSRKNFGLEMRSRSYLYS